VLAAAVVSSSVLVPVLAGCGGASPDDGGAVVTPLDGGEPVALADFDGVVLVNVWATWCPPCRAEMPALQQVADAYDASGTGVRVVGVNEGDDADSVRAFMDEVGVRFEQYLDPDAAVTSDLGIAGLPASLVLVDGEVVASHNGALDADGFRALVDEATR
jgi:thiol-disulfide isomerase/thioredoxin